MTSSLALSVMLFAMGAQVGDTASATLAIAAPTVGLGMSSGLIWLISTAAPNYLFYQVAMEISEDIAYVSTEASQELISAFNWTTLVYKVTVALLAIVVVLKFGLSVRGRMHQQEKPVLKELKKKAEQPALQDRLVRSDRPADAGAGPTSDSVAEGRFDRFQSILGTSTSWDTSLNLTAGRRSSLVVGCSHEVKANHRSKFTVKRKGQAPVYEVVLSHSNAAWKAAREQRSHLPIMHSCNCQDWAKNGGCMHGLAVLIQMTDEATEARVGKGIEDEAAGGTQKCPSRTQNCGTQTERGTEQQ
jgi:hypothetical protein